MINTQTKKFFIVLLVVMSAAVALASVEPRANQLDGSLRLRLPLWDEVLRNLSPRYNSRSFWNGLLGRGWCAPWEARLEWDGTRAARLHDCQTPGGRVPDSRPLRQKDGWSLIDGHGAVLAFDEGGRLRRWTDGQGRVWKLARDGRGRLLRLDRGANEALTFSYKAPGVISVKTGANELVFEVTENRLRSVSRSTVRWSFDYDEADNLTLVKGPSFRAEFSYDQDRDRLIRMGGDCDITLRYSEEGREGSRQRVVRDRRCQNSRDLSETIFEFTVLPDGRAALKSASRVRGDGRLQADFDVTSGRPRRIRGESGAPLEFAAGRDGRWRLTAGAQAPAGRALARQAMAWDLWPDLEGL